MKPKETAQTASLCPIITDLCKPLLFAEAVLSAIDTYVIIKVYIPISERKNFHMQEYVMGNGAIALGALAAGVNLVAGYPGTPSSEILETQETSLKALDNEDKYMPDTNFKGWMYTIMRNIFINNYRKLVRDQTFVDQTDNLYHLNLPQESGFQSTESAYDLKEMHRVVNALPREYKIPFSMHVSGFKYREIAEKLGLPLGTVKSRIFFTRQKLQQELKDFR